MSPVSKTNRHNGKIIQFIQLCVLKVDIRFYLKVASLFVVPARSRPRIAAAKRFINRMTGARAWNSPIVCVHMPRGEYLKHFAHDEDGRYIGTEEQRSWTEKELELEFWEYQDAPPRRWVRCRDGNSVFMIEG